MEAGLSFSVPRLPRIARHTGVSSSVVDDWGSPASHVVLAAPKTPSTPAGTGHHLGRGKQRERKKGESPLFGIMSRLQWSRLLACKRCGSSQVASSSGRGTACESVRGHVKPFLQTGLLFKSAELPSNPVKIHFYCSYLMLPSETPDHQAGCTSVYPSVM